MEVPFKEGNVLTWKWNTASILSSRLICYVAKLSSQCIQQDETGSHNEKKNSCNWPTASNAHGQECVCLHGEEADIKMIVHVADAVENFHWSTMIRNLELFLLRFPHYLGVWHRLIYTWIYLKEFWVSWDRKYPTHTLSKGLWSI